MPPHPNIITRPFALAIIRQPANDSQLVCGSLYRFFANGSLASQIEIANKSDIRISLSHKAKWCCQMVAAIAHTHNVAQTYHMDIKPGKSLVDDDFNLVLIDWEQNDATISTAAPEIDGTWDVEHLPSSSDLSYTRYRGLERRNMPATTPGTNGWNIWNVFPIWSKRFPRAAELAEAFSLGRSMWMLLRQPDMDIFEDITTTLDIVEEWSFCEDIPITWKLNVKKCLL